MSTSTTTTHAIEIVFRPSGGPEAARAAAAVSASVVQLAVTAEAGAASGTELARAQLQANVAMETAAAGARNAEASVARLATAERVGADRAEAYAFAQRAASSTTNELTAENKALAAQLETTNAAFELLVFDGIAKANTHLEKMTAEMVAARQAMEQLGKASDESRNRSPVPPGAVRDLEMLQSKAEGAAEKLDRIGGRMQTAGGNLTMGVTAPLMAVAGGSIAKAVELEQAMVGVAKTTNASKEELAEWRAEFLRMSEDVDEGGTESAAGLAKIAESAGQLGVAKEHLLGYTDVIAETVLATNLSRDAAASGVADLSNIMRVPYTEASNLTSALVALGNAGSKTESDILSMSVRIAGAGAQVRWSVSDVMAYANAVSSAGVEAEAGGSSISTSIVTIHNAVSKGGKELQMFAQVAGMSATEFAAAWKDDAAGAFASFLEGLNRAREAGANTFGILEALGLKDDRVRMTLLNVSGAHELLRTSLKMGAEEYQKNNARAAEAEQYYASTGAELQKLLNAVTNTATGIGVQLVPVMKMGAEIVRDDIIPAVRGAIVVFTSLPEGMQTTVVVMATLAATAGPTVVGLGMMVQTVGTLVGGLRLLGPVVAAARVQIVMLGAAGQGGYAGMMAVVAGARILTVTLATSGTVWLAVTGMGMLFSQLGDKARDLGDEFKNTGDRIEDTATRARLASAELQASLAGMNRAAAQARLSYFVTEETDVTAQLPAAEARVNAAEDALRRRMNALEYASGYGNVRPIRGSGHEKEALRAGPLGQAVAHAEADRNALTERLSTARQAIRDISSRLSELMLDEEGFNPDGTIRPPLPNWNGFNTGEDTKKQTPIQLGLPGTSFSDLPNQAAGMGLLIQHQGELRDKVAATQVELAAAGEALSRLAQGTPAFKDKNEEVARFRLELELLVVQLQAVEVGLVAIARQDGLTLTPQGLMPIAQVPGLTPMQAPLDRLAQPFAEEGERRFNRAQWTLNRAELARAAAGGVAWEALTPSSQAWAQSRQAYEAMVAAAKKGSREMGDASVEMVNAFGAMATSIADGSLVMEDGAIRYSQVISGIAQMAQSLPFVSPLGGALIGTIGGIIGGLFANRERERDEERVQRVRVEEYGDRALSQTQRRDGPDRNILQLIDPRTGAVTEQSYELGRRQRRDAVDRFPSTDAGYTRG